jgi:hypothetical protein
MQAPLVLTADRHYLSSLVELPGQKAIDDGDIAISGYL